jgi:hypothetical protein
MGIVHIVAAGPGRIVGRHILVELVDIAVVGVAFQQCLVVADIHFAEYTAAAVDSTAFAGRFGRMEVVVREHDCMAVRRCTDSTAEEDYTHWIQGVVDTVVAAMTMDKVLAQDSVPPARAERIYSWPGMGK